MAPLLDFANHCHSDYKRRCRAANVALIRKITMGSKKVSKPKTKSRSRSRSHSQDAESPSLGVDGVDPNDHENVSIKTDAKSVADVKWDRRSLRLFVQEPSADESDSQSADLDFTVQPGEEVFSPMVVTITRPCLLNMVSYHSIPTIKSPQTMKPQQIR